MQLKFPIRSALGSFRYVLVGADSGAIVRFVFCRISDKIYNKNNNMTA